MAAAPERKPAPPNPRGRGTLIAAVAVVVWAVLFLLLNRQTVTIHFVFFSTRLALFWALALAVGAGIVIGLLLGRRKKHD
jgi:uncharacterized integral membrane protein